MTLPRDILTGKMPRVYESILSRGGVLIPMQPDMDGNVPAYYPDGSTLAGTPTSGVDFAHNGRIPRVAGGNPVATLNASTDKIHYDVPVGPLTMSTGGTWLALVTPNSSSRANNIFRKTNQASVTRNGYGLVLQSNTSIRFVTSKDSSTISILDSPPGSVSSGERMLLAVTHDGTTGRMYKNGALLASGPLDLPSNTATGLAIGNYPYQNSSGFFLGDIEIAAKLSGVVLDALEIQALAVQCGPLG